jgi:hypothetical protein
MFNIFKKVTRTVGGKTETTKTVETREMTDEEEKAFDAGFAEFDKAFEHFDKAFDHFGDLFKGK